MGEKIGKTQSIHLYLFIACTLVFVRLRVRPFGNPSSKLASLLNACVDALRLTRAVNIDEGEGGSTQSVEPHYRFFLPCMDSEASDFFNILVSKRIVSKASNQRSGYSAQARYYLPKGARKTRTSTLLLTGGSSQRHTYHDGSFSHKNQHI